MINITVGIPCYNVSEFISECIESVLIQNVDGLEIIAVNDGSTDDTLTKLMKLSEENDCLRVVNQKNAGLGPTRNRIIREARGKYISFLDSDDYFSPTALEEVYLHADQYDLDLTMMGWVKFDDDSGDIIAKRNDMLNLKFENIDIIRRRAFSGSFNLMACACLFKKSLLIENSLYFPNTPHEDIHVMPLAFLYAKRHGYVNKDCYFWRKRTGSISNTITLNHIDGIFSAIYKWKSQLIIEQLWETYKADLVKGAYAYLSTALLRVKNSENDELLSRFKEKIKELPELSDFESSLSDAEKKARKDLIELILIQEENSIESLHFLSEFIKANDLVAQKSAGMSIFPENGIVYDVMFIPHKYYHAWTAGLLSQRLQKNGINSCVIDLTDYLRDENVRGAMKNFPELPIMDPVEFMKSAAEPNSVFVFNDWDQRSTLPIVNGANRVGIPTIGLIEGVNDFLDSDTGRKRNAYGSVKHVFATGENDRDYFKDKISNFEVVGIPRLMDLKARKRKQLAKKALINLNFSYGVLEEKRDEWLHSAIEGCKKANIDFVISQHPQDTSDLSKFPTSKDDVYSLLSECSVLISRFSSVIIEALVIGCPVVYHNPIGERVGKFQNPMGAYSLSFDKTSLANRVLFEMRHEDLLADRASRFLKNHCDYDVNYDPTKKISNNINNIINRFAE